MKIAQVFPLGVFSLLVIFLEQFINPATVNGKIEQFINSATVNAKTSLIASSAKPIIYSVPFTSQAPLGQWKNEIFQDGCEEASALMAMSWVNHTVLNPTSSTKAIQDLVDFEKNYPAGYRPDLSASDTAKLIQDYYHYSNIKVLSNATSAKLITELKKGNLVIAPMNGRRLKNPHFKQPGPLHHMLVIIGYDPQKQEFVTNDPGTRYGASYRYSVKTFMNALEDYPSGHHLAAKKNAKTVIVVKQTGLQ